MDELYEKLYFQLFNRMTDAITALDAHNEHAAKEILVAAQQQAEELYIDHAIGRTNPEGR